MVSVCAIETPDEELPLWTSCNTVRFSIFRSVAGRSGLGPVKLVCEAVCARGSEDHTPSIAFRHLPPKEGCRKPVLGVWVKTSLRTSANWLLHGGDWAARCLQAWCGTWTASLSRSASPPLETCHSALPCSARTPAPCTRHLAPAVLTDCSHVWLRAKPTTLQFLQTSYFFSPFTGVPQRVFRIFF